MRNANAAVAAGHGRYDYGIGSIAKQFTAAAILQFHEMGKLDLDDRVAKYLPNAPYAGQITIHPLLTHTSGLPDYLQAASEKQIQQPATFEQIVGAVAGRPAVCAGIEMVVQQYGLRTARAYHRNS